MKLGICGSANRTPGIVEALVGAKYDFIEENLFRADLLDDDAFAALCENYKKAGVEVYSCNNLFSPEVTIYGENSLAEIAVYAKRVFAKAARLGAKICVVGSGKARSIPEGMSVEAAKERFVEMLRICGDAAAEHGIVLVIDSNIANTLQFGNVSVYNLLRIAVVPINRLVVIVNDENTVDDIECFESIEIGTRIVIGIHKIIIVQSVGIGVFLTSGAKHAKHNER